MFKYAALSIIYIATIPLMLKVRVLPLITKLLGVIQTVRIQEMRSWVRLPHYRNVVNSVGRVAVD